MDLSFKECSDNWEILRHQYCSEEIVKFLEDEEWIWVSDYEKFSINSLKISVSQAINAFIEHGYEVNAMYNVQHKKWVGYIGELDRELQDDLKFTDDYDDYFEAVKDAMKLFIENVRGNSANV